VSSVGVEERKRGEDDGEGERRYKEVPHIARTARVAATDFMIIYNYYKLII